MTTDELKSAAERIANYHIVNDGYHEDCDDSIRIARDYIDRLTADDLGDAIDDAYCERLATLERERDEARAAYLAFYDRVGLVLDILGEGDKYPDKPEWRKGGDARND